MVAYHVGVEVESKIAEAISPRHYNDGFHSTGTCGSFGSAAACARLRGLNAVKTAYALGVAAAEAGGLQRNLGSMTKPFQAGHAAENGRSPPISRRWAGLPVTIFWRPRRAISTPPEGALTPVRS